MKRTKTKTQEETRKPHSVDCFKKLLRGGRNSLLAISFVDFDDLDKRDTQSRDINSLLNLVWNLIMTADYFVPLLAAVVPVALMMYSWTPVPFVVLRRKMRPYVTTICIALWLYHRVRMSEWSLLDLLVQGLEHVEKYTLQWAEKLSAFIPTALVQWLWLLIKDIMGLVLVQFLWRIMYRAVHYTMLEWQDIIIDSLFHWTRDNVTAVKSFLDENIQKIKKDVEKSFGKNRATNQSLFAIGGKADQRTSSGKNGTFR